MDTLTWTGSLGPVLNPLMLACVVVFFGGFLLNLILGFAGIKPGETVVNPDHTLSVVRTPSDYTLLAMKYAVFAFLGAVVLYILGGLFQPTLEAKGILGALGQRFLPVWISLIALFAVSIFFKRKLGLYGKLFDSPIGMVGFALVMFWIFTAVYASMIATHDPLTQFSSVRNEIPGSFTGEDGFPVYLLGGDSLGRDVFSRMVFGAVSVLQIAPFATLFAFMVGISLGLPAGYIGGTMDTVISFLANLVLAFPVILLFYLLVTPEIQDSLLPIYLGAVLFCFPILFLVVLFNSRYHTRAGLRNILVAGTIIIGGWLYLSLLSDPDPDSKFRVLPQGIDLIDMPRNILIVFVSVVFVNSPTVFRIVRGIVLDVQTRDYVAAAQTRGEGPWYIMLWEILPNARGPLIVDFCLRIGYTTILLGTLGFFGLGVSPESPDWGSTINDGRRFLTLYPHAPLPPALALMTLVLGLNLLADGLREESLRD